MKNEYIHYGSLDFNLNLFMPIKNIEMFTKPMGGFWATNIEEEYDWKQWCSDFYPELIKIHNYDKYKFNFRLCDNAKVLTIDSVDCLEKLPRQTTTFNFSYNPMVFLDYEKLSNEYDAIYVSISKSRDLYFYLYGWDIDSLLVLNPYCIEKI